VVTSANANDGCQAGALLKALVVSPPPAEVPVPPARPVVVDGPAVPAVPPAAPHAQADGAYGNRPTQARAQAAGFQMQAPTRGERRPGAGKIRNAVERCHHFFAQFGRVFRRFDRSAQRYRGWLQLAACVIFIRSGFVR
jgi:transposase